MSEMVEMLGIRQPNLSQHLSLLRLHGLVATRKVGLHIHYKLSDERIAGATQLVREFLIDQNKLDPSTQALTGQAETALYPVVRDPVCAMRLSLSEVGATTEFETRTIYFCGNGCRDKFAASPTRYFGITKEA